MKEEDLTISHGETSLLTPASATSVPHSTHPDGLIGNSAPPHSGPENALSDRQRAELEKMMGEFMSKHGWTTTSSQGPSSSSQTPNPYTASKPHRVPQETQIPTLI